MIYVFYFMFCENKKFNFVLLLFSAHVFIAHVFIECFKNLQVNSVVFAVYFSN